MEGGWRGSWKSKCSKGGCVNFIEKSVPNADKGEGVKKFDNFADITSGSSLSSRKSSTVGSKSHLEPSNMGGVCKPK